MNSTRIPKEMEKPTITEKVGLKLIISLKERKMVTIRIKIGTV